MKFLYETPNAQYRISMQNDPLWFEIFSVEGCNPPTIFNISKYDVGLAAWNQKHPEAKLANYVIVNSEESLVECLRWLQRYNIISRDEMEYQIKKFSEILAILPLTDSE